MLTTQIRPSLRLLTTELIDYAGLFPPASFRLSEALENYAKYLDSAESYMLSRFVMPAARLEKIHPRTMALFSAEKRLRLSLISSDLNRDIPAIISFRNRYKQLVSFDMLEQKLPHSTHVAETVKTNRLIMREQDLSLDAYYELPFDDTWDDGLERVIDGLADSNRKTDLPVGFKLRCGGVNAGAFPTIAQVARAILLCRDAGVRMKFTAGLHHPLRHFNATVNTEMHGFLNVFVAAMLAHYHYLNAEQLGLILAEQNPDKFDFSDDQIVWNGVAIPAGKITKLRQTRLASFGSCSFDEPRVDLQRLGLL